MQLDDFLNSRSIANLQTLQWFWAPATRRSSSKSELLRLLRQRMLSPDQVRECFQKLEEPQQEFLRSLLRLEGYEGDVQFLVRRLAQPPSAPQAQREIAEELSRRGFLSCTATPTWHQGEPLRAVVPEELGDALAEVLNLDTREPALMVSLRRYLAGLSPEERAQLAGQEPAPADLVERLARPGAVEERLAALPGPAMQRAVRLALDDHAGILPLERFPSLGLDIEDVDSPAWREALEGHLLGTFGHLSLLEHGVGDDRECLVVYQELVQACAAARAEADAALDHVYACGIDFLTDVSAVVGFVRANPCKLTAAGRFFKGARNELLPLTALRTTFFMDEETLLAFRLTVARALEFVEIRHDGRLHAAHASQEWERRPLVEQCRALLDVLLKLGESAATQPHFRPLAEAARDLLLEMEPGVWFPTNAFLSRILSRYLTGLLARGPAQAQGASSAEMSDWRYPRPSDTMGGLASSVREPLLQALNYAGVVDIGRRSDQSFVAATELAAAVLGDAALPEPGGPLLLVNPDFEVILFPEAGHLHLLHRLCAFCDRAKSEVTLHLRITRESIQRAVLQGHNAEDILAALRDHSRAAVSQNIDYSIRNWAGGVHPAEIQTLHVLELPSAEALDAAIHHPEIAPAVLRRLSPTAVALRVPQLDPKAEDALKDLGIHLV